MITHSWMFPFGKQTQIGNSTACLYITFLGRFGLATMSILGKEAPGSNGRLVISTVHQSQVSILWGKHDLGACGGKHILNRPRICVHASFSWFIRIFPWFDSNLKGFPILEYFGQPLIHFTAHGGPAACICSVISARTCEMSGKPLRSPVAD